MSSKRDEESHDALRDDVSGLTGWNSARHRLDPVRAKVPARRITINLDEDILAIFKAEARRGGPPYQVAINQALRRFLRDRERDPHEVAVEAVLSALRDETVREEIRKIG